MVKTLEGDRYALCEKHVIVPFCCSYQVYRYLAGCFGLISCRHYLKKVAGLNFSLSFAAFVVIDIIIHRISHCGFNHFKIFCADLAKISDRNGCLFTTRILFFPGTFRQTIRTRRPGKRKHSGSYRFPQALPSPFRAIRWNTAADARRSSVRTHPAAAR